MSLKLYNIHSFLQHVSGNFFFIWETTELYTLSSVPLGTSLFLLLVSFVEYFHCISSGRYFSVSLILREGKTALHTQQSKQHT
jgi:hypothetical protein